VTTTAPASPRRSQLERRETTQRALLDAAIDTLVLDGYAGATVQAVCARAGLSQGALFRYFPTREALMVAVGRDIGARNLVDYRTAFAAREGGGDRIALALSLLRERCRSRENQAFYELSMAARTNAALRSQLEEVALRYHADIEALARELLPDLAGALGDAFGVLVSTMVAVFDGESMHRFVVAQPEHDADRLATLTTLVGALVPAGTSAAKPIARDERGPGRQEVIASPRRRARPR
jgi:AcrR family transcriptional regulator